MPSGECLSFDGDDQAYKHSGLSLKHNVFIAEIPWLKAIADSSSADKEAERHLRTMTRHNKHFIMALSRVKCHAEHTS